MVLPGGALRVVAGCWVASRRGRPDIRLPAGRSETPVSITPNKTQNRMAQRIHEPTYPFASGSRTADGKSMFYCVEIRSIFLQGVSWPTNPSFSQANSGEQQGDTLLRNCRRGRRSMLEFFPMARLQLSEP